ncbi:MAG: MMPL family transporter [Deltaproteobacteria bacterium]|nr:MMPL family transporter [Deltaproteobacteria bacterium]
MDLQAAERRAEPWLDAILDRPRRTLGVVSILTLLVGSGLLRLDLRTDGAAIYPTGNVTVQNTLDDRAAFRESEQAILLVNPARGRPGFDSATGFQALRRLQGSLEALPVTDPERVRSIATLLDPDPIQYLPDVEPLLDHIPEDPEQWRRWNERLRSFPLTPGLLLSQDSRSAAFYVGVAGGVAPGHDREAFIDALERWIDEANESDLQLRLTGPLAAEVMLGRSVLRDLSWLVPFMVAVIALVLALSLRTLGGVLIPLAEVVLVLVWTLGLMGHLGVPVTLVTTILPIVLMTMAVTDEVHLLERFQARLAEAAPTGQEPTPGADPGAPRAAMKSAIADVGRPIVLTSLTTAIGFLSFLSASMGPIRDFGLFTAVGILIAMALSFTFVPAIALLLPASSFVELSRGRARISQPARYERAVIHHPGLAAALAILLALAAAPGLGRLSVQDSWIDNFDPDSALVSAERDFNAAFWGSYRFDVVLRSDEPRYFQYPDGLALVEGVRDVAAAGPHVAGVESHLLPFEVVARTIGEDAGLSSLPKATILRIVALVWGVREEVGLEQLLAWGAQTARLRLYVNSPDFTRAEALRAYLERELPPLLEPAQVELHFSGDLPVATEVVRSIVTNQVASLSWALAGVCLLLALVFRSLVRAAIVVLPLALALISLLGAMGWLGVSLGIATSMFSALAIGVGVDFALHFVHAYERARRAGSSHGAALDQTLGSSGRAIRWNAVVLGLGFLVLTLSALKPNHSLGLLLCAAMATCYAMTLLLLPRLASRFVRGGRDRSSERDAG